MTAFLPSYGINVRRPASAGLTAARGDGISDDAPALQQALDIAASVRGADHLVVLPAGQYKIGTTLRIHSNTRLQLHPLARVFLADGAGVNQNVHLITNAGSRAAADTGTASGNTAGADENIEIEGGIWDGNNPANPRGPDAPGSYTGVALNFRNVNGLCIAGTRDVPLRICEAESYNIRISDIRNFTIQDVRFEARHIRRNQDGIHFCGGCEDGTVRRIRTGGMKCTNDDLIAFVADDAMQRAQNLGGTCGPIRRVTVDDVTSDDCHSFVRLGSVWSTIADVSISNVRGGFRCNAVNADALRYCAVPVFDATDPQFASGVGLLENVTLSDFDVYRTEGAQPVLLLETRMRNFRIRNFRRDVARDLDPIGSPTVRMRGIVSHNVVLEGLAKEDLPSALPSPSVMALASTNNTIRFRLETALAEYDSLMTHASEIARLSVPSCQMTSVPGEELRDGKYLK